MTHRSNSLHRDGYMKVTTMANMGKSTEIPENKRTPFNLTTNELLKKLCRKGPDGCNETLRRHWMEMRRVNSQLFIGTIPAKIDSGVGDGFVKIVEV